jgi:hypothetical protein
METSDPFGKFLESGPLGGLRLCKHGYSGIHGLRLSKVFGFGNMIIYYYPTDKDKNQWVIFCEAGLKVYAGYLADVLADGKFKKPNLALTKEHESYIEEAIIYLEDYSTKIKVGLSA